MMNDILKSANLYTGGLQHVQNRREQWMKKHVELKDHLKEIAAYLNANATYKQGFFVDTMHAFDEDMNGTSAAMPSVTFRSGSMPMLVTFRNSMGEKREYEEDGFHISFNPTITGVIVVLLRPHHSKLNKEEPQYITLSLIDDPATLTMEAADQIISKAIELAFYSSFTGISELQEENEQAPPANQHTPIGFKLHETTEKVK